MYNINNIVTDNNALKCVLAARRIKIATFLTVSKTGPEVIKLFPCSTQLSMKFQMLISFNISGNSAFFWLR